MGGSAAVINDPGAPCGGAPSQKTTLSQVPSSFDYSVLMPTYSVANTALIDGLWACPGNQLEMDFTGGVRMIMGRQTQDNPLADWQAEAAQDSNEATVGTVLGQPALLIDPQGALARGSVTFDYKDTWTVVEGNGSLPLSVLVAVAGSVVPLGTTTAPQGG
jgi:hypothetical protein